MMLSLSTSEPTVSAIGAPAGGAHGVHHRLVDALDEVVAPLVQLVDGALGGRHLVVVVHARLVFFVPQLDVGLGQARDQGADALVHRSCPVGGAAAPVTAARMYTGAHPGATPR